MSPMYLYIPAWFELMSHIWSDVRFAFGVKKFVRIAINLYTRSETHRTTSQLVEHAYPVWLRAQYVIIWYEIRSLDLDSSFLLIVNYKNDFCFNTASCTFIRFMQSLSELRSSVSTCRASPNFPEHCKRVSASPLREREDE